MMKNFFNFKKSPMTRAVYNSEYARFASRQSLEQVYSALYAHRRGLSEHEVSEIWGVKLGKKFMMDIRPMKPFETIGNYKGRVLIVHGTDDKVVPLDYSKRAQQTYTNAVLKIIDKAGHGFKPEERVLSNQYVKEFLSEVCSGML